MVLLVVEVPGGDVIVFATRVTFGDVNILSVVVIKEYVAFLGEADDGISLDVLGMVV